MGWSHAGVSARRRGARRGDVVAGGRLGDGRLDGAVLWRRRRRGRAGARAGRSAAGAAGDAGDGASVLLGGVCDGRGRGSAVSKAGCGVRPTGRSDRMTAIPLLKLPAGLHVSDPVVPGAVMLNERIAVARVR